LFFSALRLFIVVSLSEIFLAGSLSFDNMLSYDIYLLQLIFYPVAALGRLAQK
jgi:hypothetical protein